MVRSSKSYSSSERSECHIFYKLRHSIGWKECYLSLLPPPQPGQCRARVEVPEEGGRELVSVGVNIHTTAYSRFLPPEKRTETQIIN